jgi:hypothetical protein
MACEGRVPSADEVAEFERRRAELDIGPWELTIMESIWYDYGQVASREEFIKLSLGTYLNDNPKVAMAALERCFAEGWIEFLTAEFVAEMAQELNRGGYLTPRGLIGLESSDADCIGRVSFTRAGAKLFMQFWRIDPESEDPNHWCIADWRRSDGWRWVYGTSLDAIEMALSCSTVLVRHPPEPVGRWCDRWWQRFECGLRMRYQVQEW